jgi:iron complex outermembrane recepter protein
LYAKKIYIHCSNFNIKDMKQRFILPLTMGLSAWCLPISAHATPFHKTNLVNQKNVAETISGKVTDAKGESLVGVSVSIKGTTKGTITDVDGNFTLSANLGEVLVFTYVGYNTKEMPVKAGMSNITVQLEASSTALGEVNVVGTRSNKPRTDVSRPAPVDVLNAKDLQLTGQVDLAQMVQFTSPSFNSAKYGINGVANYADPATLRGLSPDQVLVLVNGKRRHQFSALNLNVTVGKGTVVTDMNTIPSLATERIEILRDGAAAQYGSDAIAGIVNIGLKKGINQGSFKSQYGVTGEGDGGSFMAALNYGFGLGKKGSYLNATLHYQFSGATDRSDVYRGRIYTKASAPWATEDSIRKANGIWSSTNGTGISDFKVSQYGSNQTTAYQGFVNMGYPIDDEWSFYGFGGGSKKEIKAGAFFRTGDATFIPYDANSNVAIHPNGYAPSLPGSTLDYSGVVGLQRKTKEGWNMDFSTGYGYNNLDLWANNTSNPSMGAASPKDFYVGRSSFGQRTTEMNFSKGFETLFDLKDWNVAFGAQYRVDDFKLFEGDAASYAVGPLAATQSKSPGSSGRPGIALDDRADVKRSNFGSYVDVEVEPTKRLLLTSAVRYENYSDFGGNATGKIAGRYKLTENMSVRGSINKGFRAPSLQQIYNSVTTSTVQVGTIRQTKQLRSDDPRLAQVGIEDPKAEISWNLNAGVTAKIAGAKNASGTEYSETLFTLDAYQIDIANRIIISEALPIASIPALRTRFPGIQEISFFTNHLSTRTTGIDLVVSNKYMFDNDHILNTSLALTNSETTISAVKATPDSLKLGATYNVLMIDTVSRALIETGQPRTKILVSVGYQSGKWNTNVRLSYFGEVQAWEKPAGGFHRTQIFGAKTLVDISIAYNINPKMNVTFGCNNIGNVYPDKVYSNYSSYFSGQTPYTRNANQFGFNGSFYYMNVNVNF